MEPMAVTKKKISTTAPAKLQKKGSELNRNKIAAKAAKTMIEKSLYFTFFN